MDYLARAFKYVNHQNGAALFFDLEGQPPPREWRAVGGAIYRVTIEEVNEESDLEGLGFRTLNTVIIELFRDDFRRLLKSLQPRDLVKGPLAFAFGFDGEGSLRELYLDGNKIEPRIRIDRPSDVVPKGAAPAGQGAVGP